MDQPVTNQACDKRQSRFRLTCFTVFDMTTDMTKLASRVEYLAYGKETCPKTQREHYQAFAYTKTAQRWTWWQKLLAPNHFEECHGTLDQNEKYCSKSGNYTEHGTKPMGNGKRRDLEALCDEVCTAAIEGTPLDEVVTRPEARSTFTQYHNGITKLFNMQVTNKARKIDRNQAPEVIYVWGPPGSGKTRYVHDKETELYNIPPADKYKWHDNYAGQDAVLYDNVNENNIDTTQMLREIDRYFIQVSVKGGFIGWRPKRIYITSVINPEVLAQHAGFTDPREFTRRITEIVTKN